MGILFISASVGHLACSKRHEPGEPEVGPVAASRSSLGLGLYAFKADGVATFHLKTKGLPLKGRFTGVRGQITLDAKDLSRSRASLDLDVSSVQVGPIDALDGSEEFPYSAEALAWFGLGKGVPTAERNARRWATFTLSSLTELSAPAPLYAPKVGGSQKDTITEAHRVQAVALGELLLHGFRVRQSAPITLEFVYVGAVSATSFPESIRVKSRSPIVVSLLAHSVLPRTDNDVVVSEKAKELGKTLSPEALVEFDFQATRISR